MKLLDLKKQYQFCCNEYAKKFANKQGLDQFYWIGDTIGEIASFNEEYFFSMDEIVYDIDNKCPKNLILQWQKDGIENADKNIRINYRSYAMGLRYNNIRENIEDKK